jgi:hypothetical protein
LNGRGAGIAAQLFVGTMLANRPGHRPRAGAAKAWTLTLIFWASWALNVQLAASK